MTCCQEHWAIPILILLPPSGKVETRSPACLPQGSIGVNPVSQNDLSWYADEINADAFQEMVTPFVTDMSRFVQSRPEGPHKFATILSDMAQRLAVMDRYERPALSRRKFAIRAFDLAK
jgi:hypothetical protein